MELLLLNILLFNLYVVHRYKILYKSVAVTFVTLILFSTIIVRFNIINSIHNFITLSVENQHYMYICIVLFFLSFFFIQISVKTNTFLNLAQGFFLYNIYIVFICALFLFFKSIPQLLFLNFNVS